MADEDSNFEAARAFAEFGLKERAAGRRESASGPGSFRAAAQPTLDMLRRTITERGVRSILDLGCGDWHWMRDLGLPAVDGHQMRYRGWDASAEMMDSLNGEFGQPGRIEFVHRDVTTNLFPPVDLVIARDILFHLPVPLAQKVITRARNAARYMIATSFLGEPENAGPRGYLPIDGWGFYLINLAVAPFDLAQFMEEAVREPLCSQRGRPRFVCLFDFGEKAAADGAPAASPT